MRAVAPAPGPRARGERKASNRGPGSRAVRGVDSAARTRLAWPAMRSAIVRVGEGALRGAWSAGGAVRVFRGVPYARAPVGPLRWREPQPPERWDGTRPALEFGPTAPQFPVVASSLYAGGHEHTSED